MGRKRRRQRRKWLALITRLERDIEDRQARAAKSAMRAKVIEEMSDLLASALKLELDNPHVATAQRRAHARVIERERELGASLVGAMSALRGVINEIRAELAGRDTTVGMDRMRHELLGKHGPAAIAVARDHRVSVDAMMVAMSSLLARAKKDPNTELVPDGDAETAALVLYHKHPEVAAIRWPRPDPPLGPSPAQLEKARADKAAKAKAGADEAAKEKKRRDKAIKLAEKRKAAAKKKAAENPPPRKPG